MCIALIGGMNRMETHYRQEAKRLGIELTVFNEHCPRLADRLAGYDAIVLFTNKVSHVQRREAVAAAKSHGIPLHQCHSCGLCTLRDCLQELQH